MAVIEPRLAPVQVVQESKEPKTAQELTDGAERLKGGVLRDHAGVFSGQPENKPSHENDQDHDVVEKTHEHERETQNYTDQRLMGKDSVSLGGGLMQGGTAMAALEALIVEADKKEKNGNEHLKLLIAIQQQIDWHRKQIKGLQEDIAEANEQIGAFNEILDALENGEEIFDENGKLKPEYAHLQDEIDAYEAEHGKIDWNDPEAVQHAIDVMNGKIDAAEDAIDGHEDYIDALEQEAEAIYNRDVEVQNILEDEPVVVNTPQNLSEQQQNSLDVLEADQFAALDQLDEGIVTEEDPILSNEDQLAQLDALDSLDSLDSLDALSMGNSFASTDGRGVQARDLKSEFGGAVENADNTEDLQVAAADNTADTDLENVGNVNPALQDIVKPC